MANKVPQPTFDYDAKKLSKQYSKALKEVQGELNSLLLTDMQRANTIAAEANIKSILSDIKKYGDDWATVSMTKAGQEGIASTIYSLGLADSMEEALKIAKFNQVNRRLMSAAIADTQADLLAVTNNIDRRATLAIRRATAEAMRSQLAQGINGSRALSSAIRNQITQATDVAIIDARGNRWKVGTYADMLARTKMMEAHRESSINEALSEGAHYAVISSHGAVDACGRWEGRTIKLVADAPGDYPYLGDISRRELFHPNCKHLISPIRVPDDIRESLRNQAPTRQLSRGDELPESAWVIAEGDKLLTRLYSGKRADAAEDYAGFLANRKLGKEYKKVKSTLIESRMGWVDDSDSSYSRALENYFGEMYGLNNKKETNYVLGDLNKVVMKFDHDRTVAQLKKEGFTHIKVYRGVSWDKADSWLPEDTTNMTLTNRSLSSWTTRKEVAREYASYVDDDFYGTKHTHAGIIEAIVPIDKVGFTTIIGDTDEVAIIGDVLRANLSASKVAGGKW